MTPGTYVVELWNGKDGVLVGAGDKFFWVTKEELPAEFCGYLRRGERVEVDATLHAVDRIPMSQKLKKFIEKENERRKIYGAKCL